MNRYPVSRRCPNCDSADSRRVPARSLRLSQCDRICTACGTRYIPQFPMPLAIVLMSIGAMVFATGAFLAVFSVFELAIYPGPGFFGLIFSGILCWLGYTNIIPIIRTLRPTAPPRGFAIIVPGGTGSTAPACGQGEAGRDAQDAAP